jgi:hypothetical protein
MLRFLGTLNRSEGLIAVYGFMIVYGFLIGIHLTTPT